MTGQTWSWPMDKAKFLGCQDTVVLGLSWGPTPSFVVGPSCALTQESQVIEK